MTKLEFQRKINKCEKGLKTSGYWEYRYFDYHGVCDVLFHEFLDSVVVLFVEIFKPRKEIGYWLGDRNEKNLSIRKTALRLFEQICINDKLYLEY